MNKNFLRRSFLFATLLAFMQFGTALPSGAMPVEWPTASLDANSTNTYDSDSAVTNASPVWITVAPASGQALTHISIDSVRLPFGLISGGTDYIVGVNPVDASRYSYSSSGALESEIWFTGGGRIVQYRNNGTGLIYMTIANNDGTTPWTGTTFNFSINAGELTSTADSGPKMLRVVGSNGGTQVYSSTFMWPAANQNNNQNNVPVVSETPTPAKYSGPEFSGLSGMGIMNGSTGKLEGKRLDQISSIEIGGEAATFTATSATELELSLPAGLAPGLYDLVINSSAGKLTHINAIQVREPKQSFSITTRSTGKISEEQYLEHSLIAAMQIPELNKARCIVNASTQAMAEAMAKRLCAIVKASNPNIETTVVVPRSTVKNDTVFARVIYGWN